MVDREGRVGAMGCGVWGGRGNLRENREDPAPTVGVACRIASKYRPFLPRRHAHIMHPACLPPMGTLRFLSRRGMGREGTRGWAGNSRPAPTAPPLPRAQWQILKIDRNVIFFCKPHINDAARRIVILLHGSHLWGPYGFPNDAARRVATFFENLNCGIEISLPARRSPKND